MCPNQRLLLMVSYEALQRAGYSRDGTLSTTSNRIATYFGQTTDDWRDVSYSRGIDIYYIPGLLRSFAPGRLNYHYKWEGPSYSIDSTCASSASAIGLACSSLVARECDTALAGGVNSLASPAMFAGLKKGGFLSPTGACKTFQEDADGYCRAEGVGVVVLKRLEDAVNDNDNILAVIRGQARNHSAHAVSITNPHVGAQEKLYQKTLRIAGVDADQISYVEMHGTGTQAGDVTEVTAVANALGRGPRNHPLVIGAVKANVGHAEAVWFLRYMSTKYGNSLANHNRPLESSR
jgi:acyl transferase domain-containing protein